MGVTCPLGSACSQGVCKKQRCTAYDCPQGTLCGSNGKCIPDIVTCPATAQYNATVCTYPRPNDQTCPVAYYIRAPDPLYCGVRADGSRVDFPREC